MSWFLCPGNRFWFRMAIKRRQEVTDNLLKALENYKKVLKIE